MSWSPAGKRLAVIGEDPSVGVLSIDGGEPKQALPVFSLFMVGRDDPDLVPVTGPLALPGIPRWSPAGDAVAVVGLEHGGGQVALVVTTDGREGPLVSGERVLLGTCAWTNDGFLLCAVFVRRDGVHIQLVNTATGETTEQGAAWDDVCWLSLVNDRVLVAGKSGGSWYVADVTGGTRTLLSASFASIAEVAAAGGRLWVVAPVESGDMGLWSMDLRGDHLRLHIAAPSMHGMRMRPDGSAVAVMSGAAGAETVHVAAFDGEGVLDIGQRDTIMGWMDEHMPHGRLPRLHYLLTPTYEAVDDWAGSPHPAGDVETGTIAIENAPEPVPLSVVMTPDGEEQPDGELDKNAFVDSELSSDTGPGTGGWHRLARVVVATVIVLAVVAGGVLVVQGMRRSRVAIKSTPDVVTPSSPSATVPDTSDVVTPSADTTTPASPSAAAQPPSTTPPVIETYGVKPGLWVAPTEKVRVRNAAGTDNAILGYLLATERARVLAGPTVIETVPWWNVRCYDTAAQPTLTGWISGEYLRPSTAPVASPAVTPPTPAKPVSPKPVVKPTTGTVVLNSKPAGAHVVVNGTQRGVTPVSLVLPGKDVYISLTLDGYMGYTTTLTVKAGTTVHLTFPLIPLNPAAPTGN
jgi:hypothetical protein